MAEALEKNNASITKEHQKPPVQNYLKILVKSFINSKKKSRGPLLFLGPSECGKSWIAIQFEIPIMNN